MTKKNIGRGFNIFPMPVVIVGTVTDGAPNFMTAAWITKLNSDPPETKKGEIAGQPRRGVIRP